MFLSRLLYQFPTFLQRLYRGVVWRGDTSHKCVYLTFDDGPKPEVTEPLLDILDRYGVKATFFWVGENVWRYPDMAREVVRRGHTVGNHTFNHLPGMKNLRMLYCDNVFLAEDMMQQALGPDWQSHHLFRPPYGRMRQRQKRILRKHFTIVLWDFITHDYNPNYNSERILSLTKKFVRNGSVIVFHDSLKAKNQMLSAVPLVIEYLQKEGYEFRTVDTITPRADASN